MKYKDFKVMSQSEMKKVVGGNVQEVRCFLEGKPECTAPNGVAYGGWSTCNTGDFNHCYNTGTASCATDACCISFCCDYVQN